MSENLLLRNLVARCEGHANINDVDERFKMNSFESHG